PVRFDAERADLGDRAVEPLPSPRAQRDVAAFLRERDGDREADALTRAGDRRILPFESEIHRVPLERKSRTLRRQREAQLINEPIELIFLHDQRRCETDHLLVRVLAEHAAFEQLLGEVPRRAGFARDLDADEQAAAADRDDVRRFQRLELLEQVAAELRRARRQTRLDNDLERRLADGSGQRIAAERAAVVAGTKKTQHFRGGEHGGNGIDAAAERLAEDQHVGLRVRLVLVVEQPSGAAETGLNLVEHQQHAVLAAERAGRAEIARRRNDDARLGLDRLDEERDRARSDRALERRGVAVVDRHETRRERTEILAVLRLAREADDRRRAPVEIVAADDDLRLVLRHAFDALAPFARVLDGRLHGFRAGVHGQGHIHLGRVAELLEERAEPIVVHGARRQREAPGLRDERLQNARV